MKNYVTKLKCKQIFNGNLRLSRRQLLWLVSSHKFEKVLNLNGVETDNEQHGL